MIIADTGLWVALMNHKDEYHALAVQVLNNVREPLITTWPVITETCYLLLRDGGTRRQSQFIDIMAAQEFEVFDIEASQGLRISQLLKQYADLPMDLADASLVILAEHLGHGRILSVDQRDFDIYRWKNKEPFENLMFSL
jgi:uncharacterized protein